MLVYDQAGVVIAVDSEGNAYLDAYNNVAAVGHAHPHVADAGGVVDRGRRVAHEGGHLGQGVDGDHVRILRPDVAICQGQ